MPIVFSAFVPHPPVLIPDIGKENVEKLKITRQALEDLEKNLYVSQPETIIVITPHGHIFQDVFTINAYPELIIDFREFGDLTTKGKFKADLNLIAEITNTAKLRQMPLVLQSEEIIDYGTAVPLLFLAKHLPKVQIIPISFSFLDFKNHLDFGYFLKENFMNSNKRIAIIASGDLSHKLSENSPAGFSPLGKKFDETVINSLKTKNTAGLLNLDQKTCVEAGECGLRSLLILLGILRNVNYNLKIFSYESPLGIGYLVAEFVID